MGSIRYHQELLDQGSPLSPISQTKHSVKQPTRKFLKNWISRLLLALGPLIDRPISMIARDI